MGPNDDVGGLYEYDSSGVAEMTPAAQTLCRDIAEAEEWPWRTQDVINYKNRFFFEYQNPRTGRWIRDESLPFITDPGETVRMLAVRHEVSKVDVMLAIAESHLAMLLAKQGRGGEEKA